MIFAAVNFAAVMESAEGAESIHTRACLRCGERKFALWCGTVLGLEEHTTFSPRNRQGLSPKTSTDRDAQTGTFT